MKKVVVGLSGGVDSTLIVATMQRLLNQQVTAYTISFDEERFSELRYARQAADTLGVNLRHEVVRCDVVDALERLFTNYGEPFADTSAVPTWWVSQLARRDVDAEPFPRPKSTRVNGSPAFASGQ